LPAPLTLSYVTANGNVLPAVFRHGSPKIIVSLSWEMLWTTDFAHIWNGARLSANFVQDFDPMWRQSRAVAVAGCGVFSCVLATVWRMAAGASWLSFYLVV